MTERNMLGEGFIRNTLNASGTVSGTQEVSIPEMNALIDGDFSTTALTVSGGFFTSLDADLGARWKLDRIELYTDEPSNLNFDISVSVDDEEYFPITMTGAAGYWQGPVSGTTTSGAPRFIRYEHRAGSDRLVQEWTAINDDTLVEFGDDGTQTQVEIADAPIGRPSDTITELKLFNRFGSTAQGFVFIDETGDKGDDNFEIALRETGPWFGRLTQPSNQPETLKWIELDNSANVFGTRPRAPTSNWYVPVTDVFDGMNHQDFLTNLAVVTGTAYRTKFEEGTTKGWVATNFANSNLTGGTLRGNSSTTTTPSYRLNQTFGDSAATSPDSANAISNEFRPFLAAHYDTTAAVLINPGTALISDWLEGPRFFWKTNEMTAFDTDHSVASTTPGQLGNAQEQTYTFELENVTTWSGVVSALMVQAWTTSTGIGLTGSLSSVEVFKDEINKADRLILDQELPISGSWIGLNSGGNNVWRTVINTENVIKDRCIITSVSTAAKLDVVTGQSGWFLCRFADDFEYQDGATEVNAEPTPFVVKQTTLTEESHNLRGQVLVTKKPVYWYAEPGDMIGWAWHFYTDPNFVSEPLIRSDTNLSVTNNGALITTSFSDVDLGTAGLQTSLNSHTNWFTAGARPNIQFRSVPLSPYQGTGTYLTPIFDGGGDPALLQFEFESVEENGTSIDLDGNATLKTIDTRASSTPPGTETALGFRKQQFMLGAHPSDNPSRFDPKYTSNYIIGLFNAEVEARENVSSNSGDTQIENMGSNAFYHEVNQELWVLCLNISGTVSSDMRPIWDAYDISTNPPTYLRTQHMTGDIPYTHDNNGDFPTTANIFEPVGWIADYDREEIYLITREDEFAIGNGTYNGLAMTLDGEYVDVIWRNDQITQDMVDAGVETETRLADTHLQNMRTVTYRAPYFYALTNPNFNTDTENATHIMVFRLGNNPNDAENAFDTEFIGEIDLGTVAGLPTITDSSPVDTMCYVNSNDLFYFIKDDGDDIFTFVATIVGVSPSETVTITAGPIEQLSTNLFAEDALVEDFSAGVTFFDQNPWRGSGQTQQLKRMMDLAYCKDRDSLIHMLNYRGNRTRDLVRDGQINDLDYFWYFHNHTVMMEYGADTLGIQVETPSFANRFDPLWGTVSGSLPFEQVAENSLLFPTGRFAQLEYQLNSDAEREHTPYLVSSRVNQGIRVDDIPATGTKSIFLRTNIPADETIGDQSSKLKVFWQLREI